MEFLRQFQYSLILFVICITIFISGVVPNATKLYHRVFVAPEDYIVAQGVIIEMEEIDTFQARKDYNVLVSYVLEDGETEVVAVLDKYFEGMKEGMNITFLYYRQDPQYISQQWTVWRQLLLHVGSTMASLFTALLMTHPPSKPYEHRKPKTLRQRLEKY